MQKPNVNDFVNYFDEEKLKIGLYALDPDNALFIPDWYNEYSIILNMIKKGEIRFPLTLDYNNISNVQYPSLKNNFNNNFLNVYNENYYLNLHKNYLLNYKYNYDYLTKININNNYINNVNKINDFNNYNNVNYEINNNNDNSYSDRTCPGSTSVSTRSQSC